MATSLPHIVNGYHGKAVAIRPEALWYTRCPVPTATSIAIERGYLDAEFAPDAIRISSLRESNSREVRESHFSHVQENSFRHGGNIPPIWAKSIGHDVALVGLSWVDRFQAVITLPQSGIEKPADLRGADRIAAPG